jgi:hypothetical protein
MSNLEKLKFPPLEIGGSNYIVWALEARHHLCANGLDGSVEDDFVLPEKSDPNEQAIRQKASKAVCLLLRHVHPDLKSNYLEENNPAVIWKSLKHRFSTDRKQTMLPLLNDEWNKLCFYNFKTVTEYSTALYKIVTELSWCGKKISDAEKIEKTLSTFNPAERILSMQHRNANYETFDRLVAALLLEEKQGLLLQRNHDERPVPGNAASAAKPAEANYGAIAPTKFERRGKKAHPKGTK